MVQTQPMKMAAAEALFNTEQPASFSLFTIGDLQGTGSLRHPHSRLLSLLSYNQLHRRSEGHQRSASRVQQQYGPGDYVPPVALTYWSFRAMVGAGFLMIAARVAGAVSGADEQSRKQPALPEDSALCDPAALPRPTRTGWLLTELGRQPWIVFGLMKTAAGVSNTVGGWRC